MMPKSVLGDCLLKSPATPASYPKESMRLLLTSSGRSVCGQGAPLAWPFQVFSRFPVRPCINTILFSREINGKYRSLGSTTYSTMQCSPSYRTLIPLGKSARAGAEIPCFLLCIARLFGRHIVHEVCACVFLYVTVVQYVPKLVQPPTLFE
jgi:hypothetical protein